ncbi:MAG: hypothetical protein AAF984_10360, partial [Verrucomicrobiota bacterium]
AHQHLRLVLGAHRVDRLVPPEKYCNDELYKAFQERFDRAERISLSEVEFAFGEKKLEESQSDEDIYSWPTKDQGICKAGFSNGTMNWLIREN